MNTYDEEKIARLMACVARGHVPESTGGFNSPIFWDEFSEEEKGMAQAWTDTLCGDILGY